MRAASSVVDVVSAVIDPIAGRGWGPGCWGRYGGRTLFATQPSHSEIRLPHWHRMPTCHPFARSSSSSKQAAAAAAASGAPICMHIISIVSSAFPPPHPHAPALKSNNGAKQITRQQTILSTHTHALAHAQAPPPPPQAAARITLTPIGNRPESFKPTAIPPTPFAALRIFSTSPSSSSTTLAPESFNFNEQVIKEVTSRLPKCY